MLEWQTREFLARESHRDEWTVYVRPEIVVEIAFSDLQASPRYPGGLALQARAREALSARQARRGRGHDGDRTRDFHGPGRAREHSSQR